MKRFVLFDLDNTLLNSDASWHYVLDNKTFKDFGLKVNQQFKKERSGISNYEAAKLFVKLTGVDKTVDEVYNNWLENMSYCYQNDVTCKKGAKEFLPRLKQKGYRIIVVSATEKFLVEQALKRFGLDEYIERIYTETILQSPKRSVEFYGKVLRKLGTSYKDVFLFEDSIVSLRSAYKMNVDSCALIHEFNKKHKRELKAITNLVIKDYTDKRLINIL